jgi:hypothetical protein
MVFSMRRTTLRGMFLSVALAAATARVGAQSSAQPADSQRMHRGMAGMQGSDVNSPELAAAISELLADTGRHMRMAPHRVANAADSARAAAVVSIARSSLAKYKDVRLAEADGFERFLPRVETQAIYHYTSAANAMAAMFKLDASRPTSLLYRKDAAGHMVLVGVMYTAPWMATSEELDGRLPLGMAHWHEHVNFCRPGRAAMRSGREKPNAESLLRWLRISSREECEAMGGRFLPRVFGWMAHAYVFAGDSPKTIWGGDGKDQMHVH